MIVVSSRVSQCLISAVRHPTPLPIFTFGIGLLGQRKQMSYLVFSLIILLKYVLLQKSKVGAGEVFSLDQSLKP